MKVSMTTRHLTKDANLLRKQILRKSGNKYSGQREQPVQRHGGRSKPRIFKNKTNKEAGMVKAGRKS